MTHLSERRTRQKKLLGFHCIPNLGFVFRGLLCCIPFVNDRCQYHSNQPISSLHDAQQTHPGEQTHCATYEIMRALN
jgi:hypothetical protein